MSEGNGNGLTPQQQAWETARERAREQAREQGQSVRDDEIRCIKSKGLSCWAKLLFWILSKLCWETSAFLYNRRVGSVCITGRQLNLHFGFPMKRLYAQTKRTKDKSGAVIATRRAPGAIEELELAGLVWVSQKRIENIPSNKWPNVFNLTTLVPQIHQPSLGLLEGVTVVESSGTNGGSTDFLTKNGGGSGQTPQNGLAKDQRAPLARTNGGTGQEPPSVLAKNQRGCLARTPVGSTDETDGGSGQEPTGVLGKNRRGCLATPASGAPKETVRPSTDPLDLQTGEAPTDVEFEKWVKGLEGEFPGKLRRLSDDLKARLRAARSDKARKEWKRRADAVDELLLGGKVEDAPKEPKPVVHAPSAPKLPTSEERIAGARWCIAQGKPIPFELTEAEKSALEADNPVPA